MSTFELILLLWVAPSLITFLLYARIAVECEGLPMDSWNSDRVIAYLIGSAFYPISLTAMFFSYGLPFLIKTRRLKK